MKKKNTHQTDLDPLTNNDQKIKGRGESILADEIVIGSSTDFKNDNEKIKLLAHAISSINECICITDANNNLLFVNDAFVKTYDYSREELIGNSIDLVRGSQLKADYAEIIRSATIKDGWVGELMNRRKDGTEFPISLSTAVVHDDNGSPIALIGVATDISERKKNESQLRNSEESYRGLFNTIQEALYILDKDGFFIDVNLGAEKMYGYKRNEFIGKTPEFLSAPGKNDLQKVAELLQQTFETGKSNSFEFWGLRKNGETFPKTVTINKGNYFGQEVIIAIGHDITGQRQRELILKESEERYKSIFHDSNAVLFLIDPITGDIIDANASACEYYGYTKEQFTSLKISDINILPQNEINNELGHALNKTRNHFFFQHKLANGQIRDVEVYSGAIEINGKRFLHSIIHDITEKKQIELALQSERELFIGGPVTVFKWKATPEASTEYVSPNVITTLGYSPEEFLNNTVNFKQLIHPDDRQRVSDEVQSKIDLGIFNYEQQYRIKNKNGVYRWYFDFTRVITDEEGKIISFHGYLFDNTAQKEADEALICSEQELRKTNKMKDKFFSILSHDLRSPFQGLIGMANILAEDDELTTEERKEFTQKLYEGLKTQFNFIDGLLTWNRAQRGAIEFNPTLNDISSLITETVSLLNNSIENKELDLFCDLPERALFNFDRNMIATVVRNLISNAIKFTHRGGKIKISLKESPNSISFIIQDTGVGIKEDELKKLWGVETYYSTKGTDGEGGTGLGLILCKDFVEKHGGKISVESEVDKGSTFTFSLPESND